MLASVESYHLAMLESSTMLIHIQKLDQVCGADLLWTLW